MRVRALVAGLLVLVLLGGNLVVGAGDVPDGPAAADKPERTMSFEFDCIASKVAFLGTEWDLLTMDGCQAAYGAGKPDIPVKVVRLELPGPIDRLDVRFGGKTTFESVRLAPVGPDYLHGLDMLDLSKPLVDTSFYSKDRLLPAVDHQLFKVGTGLDENGERVWVYEVHLFPLRYNPARGTVVLQRDCELALHYKTAPAPMPAGRGPDERYIIITSTDVNTSGALGPLVAWKTKKGLPAKIYEISWIEANYAGYDTPEKLRNFLMDRYANNYMQWVMLVGDTDTVPTRLVKNPSPVAPFDDASIATDTYYACMETSTTWDVYNNNHVYGEFIDNNGDGIFDSTDLDDAYPDVWVGRFATSDIAKITSWANNAVNYEKATNSGAWMNSLTMIAPNAGAMGTAADTEAKMEQYFNKTVQNWFGYLGAYYGKIVSSGTVTRLYESRGALSRTAIINSFNNGFALGLWLAQGTNVSIKSPTIPGDLFSYSDVPGLTNGAKKPVIFGMSSSAGRFDDAECLGEALTENNTNNGAMAFIGASRVTSGTAALGYPGNGAGNGTAIQMDFLYQMELGRLYDASLLYLGKTLGYAKRGYGDSQWLPIFKNDYTVKAFYEYNLLGEPNSPVWTDVAGTFNPQTRVAEDATYKNVSIRVRSTLNSPMNHTLVCLEYGSAGFYQYLDTSVDGYANLTVPKTMAFGNITITRADFSPFEYAEMPLDDTYPPYTDYLVTPALPDGKDNWYKTAPTVRLLTESGVTTYYRWDDGIDQVYGGEVLTPLEGEHTLKFHAVDWKNNKEGEKAITFKVDSQVPNTTVVVSPAAPDGLNGWYVHQPTVTLSLPGDTGSPATIKYKLDIDPDYYSYGDAIVLEEGQHTLHFYSQDDAGNKEQNRTMTFKVDTVAPTSGMTVSPVKPDGQNGWYVKQPSVSFFVDDPTSSCLIRYWWDGDAAGNLSSGGSIKPAEGVHILNYQGVDEAGNAEALKNLTMKLDSKVPLTNILTDPIGPDGMNGWYVTRPSLTFDTGDPASVSYKWNNEPYACATGPLVAPEGVNTLTYYAVDDAGNKETAKFAPFKVDTAIPSTTITVSPADKGDQWYNKKPRVKLANTENCTINYYWGTEIDNVQKYVREFEVPEGREILHYWSIDEAGNKETERTKGFDVDSLAPSVSFTPSVVSLDVGGSVSFELRGTDPNGVTDFYLDFGDGNNTGWVQNLTVTHTYGAAGNYTVTCKGRDPAGNEGNAAAKSVEVKATYVPPVVTPPVEGPKTNWLLIGGIIAIILVMVIVAVVATRRRRPKDDFFVKEQQEKERLKETMPAYDFTAGRTEAGVATETTAMTGLAGTAAEAPAAPAGDSRFFNCPKCGNEVERGAEYCYTCGERFKKGGPGGSTPPAGPAQPAYGPRQPEAPAYAPKQPTQPPQQAYSAPAEQYYDAAQAQPAYEAPAEPAYEAPAQPVQQPAAPAPAHGENLDDIMSRLESISHPAAAPAAARAAPARQPLPPPPGGQGTVSRVPANEPGLRGTQHPAPGTQHPATPAPPAAAASAQTGTGKKCPKCGSDMARLVDLPGAQGEQLRKLNARGQHAFQCRNCNHFEISAWNPGT